MDSIKLTTKAETLSGLCGELEKRQSDFENYAGSILREAITKNGGNPIKFAKTDLRDKSYNVVLKPDTFHINDRYDCCAFVEEESGETWYGLAEVENDSLVGLVKGITEAVEKGKEA